VLKYHWEHEGDENEEKCHRQLSLDFSKDPAKKLTFESAMVKDGNGEMKKEFSLMSADKRFYNKYFTTQNSTNYGLYLI